MQIILHVVLQSKFNIYFGLLALRNTVKTVFNYYFALFSTLLSYYHKLIIAASSV